MRIDPGKNSSVQRPRSGPSAGGRLLGESRLATTGLITSGVAHGLAAAVLSSLWGAAALRLIPPPQGRNSIELKASPAVWVQAESAPPSAVIAAEDRHPARAQGADPSRPRPRRLPLIRRAAEPARLEGDPHVPQGGEPTWHAATSAPDRAQPVAEAAPHVHPAEEVSPAELTGNVRAARAPAAVSTASVAAIRQSGQQAPTLPQPVFSPLPAWPPEAQRARLTGRVVVRTKVGPDGRVLAVSLYRSSGVRSFDQSALSAVRKWRFEPARRMGVAVEMEIAVPIRFSIEDDFTR